MARIAKKKLSKQHLEQLFTQLNKTLSSLSSTQVNGFLNDLLGPEERTMLAKRLAIIVMLTEGHSLYRTATTLTVSTATAEKIRKRIDRGRYTNLIKLLKKSKTDYGRILDTIDAILHFGGIMPHYVGKDRYRTK